MEGIFQLCWRQHGGSGLGFTLRETLEMYVDEFNWFLERVGTQREREARDLKNAARGK